MELPFETLIKGKKPVLVDFNAAWCGPCQMMNPILTEVKQTLGERIAIIKVDVDKNQEIANHYRIKTVPTLILFQEGKLLWRQSGVVSKSDLVKIIMDHVTWPELPNNPDIL